MTNRIHLAAIVEREGRILLIRQTPRSQWELPGGPLTQRQSDADAAVAEILDTFGIMMTEPEERFIETLYLPDGDGQIVFNLYGAADWSGEPEIPIGMGAGWYTFAELDAIDMHEAVRTAVLVAYGLRDAPDADAKILQAMTGSASNTEAIQPPLGAVPPSFSTSEKPAAWARPAEEPVMDSMGHSAQDEWVEPVVEVGTEAAPFVDDSSAAILANGESSGTNLDEAIADEDREEAEVRPTVTTAPEPKGADSHVIDATRFFPAPPVEAELTRRQKGFDVLGTLGKTDPSVAFERMKAQYPELAADIVDFALGEVWSDTTLSRRERSLLVVAMLSAMGGREGPLLSHLNGALNHGATPDEIVEALRMVSVYAGFPAALEAWRVMEDVFRSRRVAPSGRPQ